MTPAQWDRLVARLDLTGDCWTWTGYKVTGYGGMKIEGRHGLVHRLVWETLVAPIPSGLFLDHTCHNRACANPAHLRLATMAENNCHRRGPSKNNACGYRGVRKHGPSWQAKVSTGGRNVTLGVYPTPELAAEAAAQARLQLFGAFAGGS